MILEYLKNHPFAVDAFFEKSLVLTFTVPKAELESYIPECLTLDTFQDQWAFIAVAMVQTKELRPKGFPEIIGNDFFLIGYRVFVRYTTSEGKRLRGLYILKSETNKKKMEFLGNLFTQYSYTTTDITTKVGAEKTIIASKQSDFSMTMDTSAEEVVLPITSPFATWKDARRFAGPLPFTFTYQQSTKEVLIIEGVRKDWKPKPVAIEAYAISFLDTLQLKGLVLASAFEVCNVPYSWKKGRLDPWKM